MDSYGMVFCMSMHMIYMTGYCLGHLYPVCKWIGQSGWKERYSKQNSKPKRQRNKETKFHCWMNVSVENVLENCHPVLLSQPHIPNNSQCPCRHDTQRRPTPKHPNTQFHSPSRTSSPVLLRSSSHRKHLAQNGATCSPCGDTNKLLT